MSVVANQTDKEQRVICVRYMSGVELFDHPTAQAKFVHTQLRACYNQYTYYKT